MSASVVAVNVQIPAKATAAVVADFVAHALRVGYVTRRDVDRLAKDEWEVPGVYVLLADDGSGHMYVGKATNLRARLLQHRSKPKFAWARSMTVKRDTSHGFNSAEIGYLEGRLAVEAGAIPGVTVVEGKRDLDDTLPAHMLISLDEMLESIIAALRLAGIDTYKEADTTETPQDVRATPGRITRAIKIGTIADLLEQGLLRAGAELHLSQGGRSATGRVTSSGEVVVNGVSFASPSAAAATALGTQSSNGWTTWRVGSVHGPTLDSLRDQLFSPPVDGGHT